MLQDAQFRWLMLEGVIPLFGAGLMYVLWGGARYLTYNNTPPFDFAWRECVDSMGWLYGALIIAIQSAIRSWTAISSTPSLGIGCLACGIVCFLLLLSAMNERGQNSAWQPPRSTKIFSILLVCAILFAGYQAQAISSTPSLDNKAAVAVTSTKPGQNKEH